MAMNKEENLEGEEQKESMIPVFTVLKNDAILKNIFVVNRPATTQTSISGTKSLTAVEDEENPDQGTEEVLLVGRHHDCHIVLLHPSISRFHLQINSRPSSQKLFVTDLSSVHGTWVSEKKIEPGLSVELNEGDTIRVGGSTRVYKLHWIPLSRAYDMENPFVAESDLAMIEKKKEESAVLEEENEVKLSQDETLLATEFKYVEEKDSLSVGGKEVEPCQEMNSTSYVNGEIHSLESAVLERENEVKLSHVEKIHALDETSLATEIKCVEEKDSLLVEGKEEGLRQDTNSWSYVSGEIQSLKSTLEDKISLFSENCGSILKREIIFSAPLTIKSAIASFNDERKRVGSPPKSEVNEISSLRTIREVILETKSQQFDEPTKGPEYHPIRKTPKNENSKICTIRSGQQSNAVVELDFSFPVIEMESHSATGVLEAQIQSVLSKHPEPGGSNSPGIESMNSSLPVDLSVNTFQPANEENHTQEPSPPLKLLYEEGNLENSTANEESNHRTSKCSEKHAVAEILEEVENKTPPRMYCGSSESTSFCSVPNAKEYVNSSLPIGFHSETRDIKESQNPPSVFNATENRENLKSFHTMSEKKLSSLNIWSRRGKPATPLQLETNGSRGKCKEADIDFEVEWNSEEDFENRSVRKALFPGSLEDIKEHIFTPDKEKYTPLKSLKKKAMLEEVQISNSRRSSTKTTFGTCIQPEEDIIASSDKENQTPKVLQRRKLAKPTPRNHVKLEEEMILKERRAERVPLQSLFVNSPGKSILGTSVLNAADTGSTNSINCTQTTQKISNGERKRRWTMIADTTSLIDKKSRKSLQLLQGLKGTRLIIPKMVIRELDCLKRRGGLLRRTSEASLALQWIEDCMVKTKWWIHVQSSVEEGRSIAPTPPASPDSHFSEGTWGETSSAPSSARGIFLEIISPTAEDHILDSALWHRKMNNDGQSILLTNDVTLTVKSLAEGLLCETAQVFRDSLVNPFSGRFLWADSSPRGQTWSVLDDLILKEKYYQSPSKKLSNGEDAKGLKLILLHNSHYGQR